MSLGKSQENSYIQHSKSRIFRSELDSDSETPVSSSPPSSARALSPNISRGESEDSRDYASVASLDTFQGSPLGSGVREELLGNSI